jgi:DNA-binding response OmpR family regulator
MDTPLSVLVVDDHPDAADSLAEVLALHGHRPRVALGGADALAMAESEPPDVVLTDLVMPGVDGFELARRLRERTGSPPVLVALTGCGSARDRERVITAGFDLYLVKPVEPAALVGVLRNFTRAKRPKPGSAC